MGVVQPSRWPYVYMVSVGVLISTMDSSMINVALPSIMRSFSASLAVTQLIVLAYLSTITITLVLWGQLADIHGRGRIYLLGILTFAIATTGCSLASSAAQLIAIRCVQGAGAAMMMSSGPAIIKSVFPPEQIGRGLGLVGLATSAGLMSGPVISGLLIQHFSWRAVFLVTLPLSLSVYVVGRFKAGLGMNPEMLRHLKREFDWLGFTLWAAAIALCIIVISFNALISRGLLVGLWCCLIAVIGAFALHERRVIRPLLPYALFRRRYFATASVTSALSFTVLFMVILLLPFYLDYVKTLTADRIGLVMLALPSSLVIVSPLAGWLYDHIGARLPTTLGLAVSCLATAGMTGLHAATSITTIVSILVALGAGQALFLSPNSASVLARVEEGYVGITSGILATARNLGMLLGVGVAGAVFSFVFTLLSGGRTLRGFEAADVPHFLSALHWTFWLAAVLALAGSLLSALRDR